MCRGLIIVFAFLSVTADAQVDTVLAMETIEIVSTPIKLSNQIGVVQELATEDGSTSLAEVLSNQGNVYIKNYGVGSLSTPSIRGGSAGHTMVLWNGVPLQSPMLGLLDLSLIPDNVTESITLQKGGNSTMWGSGAVSGLVSLDSEIDDSKSIEIGSHIGSFGFTTHDASIRLGSESFTSVMKFHHSSSDRDFTYQASEFAPVDTQRNAQYHRNHLLQDFYYKLGDRHRLNLHLWVHESNTQIPATTVQRQSSAYQEDRAFRSSLIYKYIADRYEIDTRAGYVIDHNDYYDPATALIAKNKFSSTFFDGSVRRQLDSHSLMLGVNACLTEANTQGYKDGVSDQTFAVFVSDRYTNKKFSTLTNLRLTYNSGQSIVLIPSIGIEYRFKSKLMAHIKIDRNFKTPTLNDRFWSPGGNADLLPEIGWSYEAGLVKQFSIGRSLISWNANIYHRNINNWIMWTPSDENFFWTARNINTVTSQGFENTIKWTYSYGKTDIEIVGGYDYTSSTFGESLQLPSIEKGEQLFYVPRHQGSGGVNLSHKGLSFGYNHQWIGSTTGINEDVEAYQVGRLSTSYLMQLHETKVNLSLAINNIFDSTYYIVERRPIPGRHYQIGIKIKH